MCHWMYSERSSEEKGFLNDETIGSALCDAFQRLPKLREFHCTDYRILAHRGEKYDDLLNRLFGQQVEPDIDPGCYMDVSHLFEVLVLIGGFPESRIDTFCYGEHPFILDDDYLAHARDQTRKLRPSRLYPSTFCGDTCAKNLPFISRLKELTLPIVWDVEWEEPQFPGLEGTAQRNPEETIHRILASAARLTKLSFAVDGMRTSSSFRAVMVRLQFPYLECFELHRWRLNTNNLRTFLSAHGSTPRELRLIYCICPDGERELAEWAGQEMSLTGVEMTVPHSVVRTAPRRVGGATSRVAYLGER